MTHQRQTPIHIWKLIKKMQQSLMKQQLVRLVTNKFSILMTRGFSEEEALTLIVNGFMEPFTKELPMEYAVELNRLIKLEMDNSVG